MEGGDVAARAAGEDTRNEPPEAAQPRPLRTAAERSHTAALPPSSLSPLYLFFYVNTFQKSYVQITLTLHHLTYTQESIT